MERNAKRYYQSSLALFLPAKPIEEIDGFELRLAQCRYLFCGSETPFNNSSSAQIALDKYYTNKLLDAANVPVPRSIMLDADEFNPDQLEHKLAGLRFPLVVKPIDGSKGTGVLCNIRTLEELYTLLPDYFISFNHVVIEEFHAYLKSYRVMVFNNQVLGVVLRHPAQVIGDGEQSIVQLIEQTNIQRKKINPYIGPIVLDTEAQIKLDELGIDEHYIPVEGEQVTLCYTSNATRGGTFENLGLTICKENRQLMIHIAKTLDLQLAGIDVQCADINIPIGDSAGVIIEVNHRPNVRLHELPMIGRPQYVTRKIMRSLIYRHPLAYLGSLYSNKRTSLYVRSVLLAATVTIIYLLTLPGALS